MLIYIIIVNSNAYAVIKNEGRYYTGNVKILIMQSEEALRLSPCSASIASQLKRRVSSTSAAFFLRWNNFSSPLAVDYGQSSKKHPCTFSIIPSLYLLLSPLSLPIQDPAVCQNLFL